MMGKKLGLKDYRDPTVQKSFSDAEAAKVIKDGKGKMKGAGGKLSDADIDALVAYFNSFLPGAVPTPPVNRITGT